jgi:glycosyltransferase involved in cell wall biosynthesis
MEHIVIDGGSKDETINILKQYPQLQWISEKDEGHFHAMNKGIARAVGDWIVILNADDCFRPGALARVAREIGAHPEWDAVFGDVVYVDAGGDEIYRRAEVRYNYDVLRSGINYVNHQTLFVRRPVYDRIGVYRYKDFPKASCYEFTLRLGKEKCRVGHVRACLVNFRIHDNISSTVTGLQEMSNEGRIIRKEYGVPERWQKLFSLYGRFLRQLQKLLYLGKCDIISGTRLVRKHRQKQAASSGRALH